MNYSIKTFGCKVNTFDSALLQKQMRAGGYKEEALKKFSADVHIVNTCAVTEEAVKEAKRWVKFYRKNNPQAKIVLTGCAAQTQTESFSNLKEINLVAGNSYKPHLSELLKGAEPVKVFKKSIFKNPPIEAPAELASNRTRLFFKIQDGCNSFCTFCIIPFARGKSRSLSPSVLEESLKKHCDKGVKEAVLTGVHIGDYKTEEGKDLADLAELLLKKTKIQRLRLSSLEPVELNDRLMDLYQDSRMCSHFHLSIQSTEQRILEKMKRKYKAQDVKNCLLKIHKKLPKAFVGIDLITGFADETKKEFEESYRFLKESPWTKLHVFPYSPRPLTYAEKNCAVLPRAEILKRSSFLRRLSQDRYKQESLEQIGRIKKVLPLKKGLGLSRDYWPVVLTQEGLEDEVLFKVQSLDKESGRLKGMCIVQ